MDATGGATIEVLSPGEDNVASVQDIAIGVEKPHGGWGGIRVEYPRGLATLGISGV